MHCLKSRPAIVQALAHCMQRWSHERELFLKISCFAVAIAQLSEPGPRLALMYESALLDLAALQATFCCWVGKLFITSDSVNTHLAKEPQGQCVVHVLTSKKQTKQLVKQQSALEMSQLVK